MWFNILKKTKTDEILEKWHRLMDADWKFHHDKLWEWFETLTIDELNEASLVSKETYFSNDRQYSRYLETIEGFINMINAKKEEEEDRAWVKANPEKAKERDKKNEESRLRNQKANEESNAREEARNRKIWESHARAKTAKRKPPKRKGQRRRN